MVNLDSQYLMRDRQATPKRRQIFKKQRCVRAPKKKDSSFTAAKKLKSQKIYPFYIVVHILCFPSRHNKIRGVFAHRFLASEQDAEWYLAQLPEN